ERRRQVPHRSHRDRRPRRLGPDRRRQLPGQAFDSQGARRRRRRRQQPRTAVRRRLRGLFLGRDEGGVGQGRRPCPRRHDRHRPGRHRPALRRRVRHHRRPHRRPAGSAGAGRPPPRRRRAPGLPLFQRDARQCRCRVEAGL
ncbi:MAG: Organic hydroperoxide resistance protein, partial [uncultured Sphingomonadaceae bacterium]